MNVIARYVRTDIAHEQVLRITENKNGFCGALLNGNGRVIDNKVFRCNHNEENLQHVKDYFGFTEDNSYAQMYHVF